MMNRLTGLLVPALLLPLPGAAQVFDPDPAEGASLVLHLEKPLFSDAEGLAFWSSILEVDAVLPVGGRSLRIGLPMAVAGDDGDDGTSLYAGNLRLALLFGEPDALDGIVALTLPTATNLAGSDLAAIVGLFAWLDDPGKWFDDTVALRGEFLPGRDLDDGGRIGLRLGTYLLAPTDVDNLNAYLRLGGWGRFPTDGAEFRADLGSTYLVNSDDGFGSQFTAHLSLQAALTEGTGRPGLFVRVPLDGDSRDLLDLSVGVRVQF